MWNLNTKEVGKYVQIWRKNAAGRSSPMCRGLRAGMSRTKTRKEAMKLEQSQRRPGSVCVCVCVWWDSGYEVRADK